MPVLLALADMTRLCTPCANRVWHRYLDIVVGSFGFIQPLLEGDGTGAFAERIIPGASTANRFKVLTKGLAIGDLNRAL